MLFSASFIGLGFKDASEFLTMMAQKMGRLKKGGIPDVEKAAFKVVEDWNTGKIRSGRKFT